MMTSLLLALSIGAAEPATAAPEVFNYDANNGGVGVSLFVPRDVKVLRGIVVHMFHASKLTPDDRWCDVARQIGFAKASVYFNPNGQKSGSRAEQLGKGLEEALKALAEKTGHPELPNLPLVGTGHSAGGMAQEYLLKNPDRMLTVEVDCGWIGDPAKYENASHIPALFTIGAIPDGFKMLPGIEERYLPARKKGLPWGLGVQWGCAHNFGQSGALFATWTEAVANLRLPKDPPADGKAALRPVKPEDGWLADRGTTTGNYATIAPWADYKGDRETAVWLPDRATAYVWRAYMTKDSPLVMEAKTSGGTVMGPLDLKNGRKLVLPAGEDITFGVTIKKDPKIAKVRYYAADQLIGTAEAAPWEFTWKQPKQGVYSVYAEWESADGTKGVTNLTQVRVQPADVFAAAKKQQ